MELRQLRYFAEVAETGSYSGAAAKLHVAQPALWQQVKSLEVELRVPLFERTGRSVRLTRHGQVLLGRVAQVLDQADLLLRLARDLSQGRSGLVVVACTPPHISRLLGAVVGRYRARHPDVVVEFREHPPIAGLPLDEVIAGSADVALGVRTPDCDGFPVYRVNVVAAVPPDHPLAGLREVSLDQLDGEPLLVSSRPSLSRGLLDAAWAAPARTPRIVFESPSPVTLVSLGSHGVGIPLLADDALAMVREQPAPVVVDQGRPIGAEVWLHWRTGLTITPALDAFIGEVRAFADAALLAGPEDAVRRGQRAARDRTRQA